jgi:hypothetical protein
MSNARGHDTNGIDTLRLSQAVLEDSELLLGPVDLPSLADHGEQLLGRPRLADVA